ncbi:S8/S53 family peptidase [Amycolatopsis sp. NPDC005003]
MTENAELIVDTKSRAEVEEQLEIRGVWKRGAGVEVDERLRLARIAELVNLSEYAQQARRTFLNEIDTLERRTDRLFTDLDVLLYDLRAWFTATAGTVPAMGKNRDTFIGYPQHKYAGEPVPVSRPLKLAEGRATNRKIRVGVVDTPLFWHAQFSKEMVEADELSTPDADGVYAGWQGHATAVVGKIHELAPDAYIIVKAGLDGQTGRKTVWETARKIAAFDGNPAIDVLNLSCGTTTGDGQAPMALRRAIDTVKKANPGLLIVAAAGNQGSAPNPPLAVWPAAMTEVEAVGAENAPWSEQRMWVDLVADGTDVHVLFLDGKVRLTTGETLFDGSAMLNGTSFAAACVSGALAAELEDTPNPAEALRKVLAGPLVSRYSPR